MDFSSYSEVRSKTQSFRFNLRGISIALIVGCLLSSIYVNKIFNRKPSLPSTVKGVSGSP